MAVQSEQSQENHVHPIWMEKTLKDVVFRRFEYPVTHRS